MTKLVIYRYMENTDAKISENRHLAMLKSFCKIDWKPFFFCYWLYLLLFLLSTDKIVTKMYNIKQNFYCAPKKRNRVGNLKSTGLQLIPSKGFLRKET